MSKLSFTTSIFGGMRKLLLAALATAILLQSSIAQTIYPVTTNSTPAGFNLLLLPNYAIANNDTVNELIVDLAEPMMTDSVVERRKQHHRLFMVGWLIHAFGNFNWRTVTKQKQKFVGTAHADGRSGSEEFTEYDIKYHLHFNLPKYFEKINTSLNLQKKYHRQDVRPKHKTNYKAPPFVMDTANFNNHLYDLGLELTPARCFRPQLHQLFFPTMPGRGMLQHPNFETKHPTIGAYGVSCLDCNHQCHPELHPYEWIWWLKVTEPDSSYNKTWLAGLFYEASNRFKNWSKNPVTGTIKVPFAFKQTGTDSNANPLLITVDHLVFNRFNKENMSQLPIPATAFSGTQSHSFVLQAEGQPACKGLVQFNYPVFTEGLKFWLSNLNYDPALQLYTGYFNLGTSAHDLYTARINFSAGN